MASAKLFASSSSPNSDVKPRPSSSLSDQSNTVKFEDNDAALTLSLSGIFRSSQPQRKTVEEVWGEIVAVREKKECKVEPPDPNDLMTLEDFLAKADATEKECVKVERFCSDGGGILGYEYGMMAEESGGRRVKRRTMSESFDKAVQQRQRRMIKNRESAARSRERKQAYQVELEAMVVKLEEENELLLKEKEERIKQRHKELMEKIVPVVEKRKPQCALRRVSSAQW